MGLGTIIKFLPSGFVIKEFLSLITQPTFALGIGTLFAFRLVTNKRKSFINNSIKQGVIQAAPILIITGMGGALGSIIQTIPLENLARDILACLESSSPFRSNNSKLVSFTSRLYFSGACHILI